MAIVVPTRSTMPLDEIMDTFRSALLSLIPHAEKVGIHWKAWEAYDGWDRIEEALFESMVSECAEFAFGEGQVFGLATINNINFHPDTESLLFDLALGPEFRFLGLVSGVTPFDTASFVTSEGERVEKKLSLCRFAVRGRYRDGRESQVTQHGCVG